MSTNAAIERRAEIDAHPLMRGTMILPTVGLEAFVNAIQMWFDSLLPGAFVWGYPRVGKSRAIRFLIRNIKLLLGSAIPTTLISCGEATAQITTENRFFAEVLYALGYDLPRSGTAAVKRRRTIDFIIEQTRRVDEYRFLLLVDEAQWLSESHFRFLMDLHNQLDQADIRLITILVGQPELVGLKSDLAKGGQRHFLGRFMTGSHEFRGVCGEGDVRRMLEALDTGTEYPVGANITHTEFFVPEAFAAGWRMADQTSQIYTTLLATLQRTGVPKMKEFPVQPIMAVIRRLLRDLADLDSPTLILEQEMIERAVYEVALMQMSDYAWQVSPEAGLSGP